MVGKYKINLNSKEIFFDNISLKLTEKEIKMIIYISESLKPVTIDELQKKIWEYGQDLETHTVETHIHRLRKKILDNYNDKKFIISTKNGYQIIEKK
jgi:DNA-binding response OmpR family regulator